MHTGSRRPAKHEQRDGNEDARNARKPEILFRWHVELETNELGAEIEDDIHNIEDVGDEGTDDDAEEWETRYATFEVVDTDEHHWE